MLRIAGSLAILGGVAVFGYATVQMWACDSYLLTSFPVETVSPNAEMVTFASLTADQQALVRAAVGSGITAADPLTGAATLEGRYVQYEGATYAFELTYRACSNLVWAYQILGGILVLVGGSYVYLTNRIR